MHTNQDTTQSFLDADSRKTVEWRSRRIGIIALGIVIVLGGIVGQRLVFHHKVQLLTEVFYTLTNLKSESDRLIFLMDRLDGTVSSEVRSELHKEISGSLAKIVKIDEAFLEVFNFPKASEGVEVLNNPIASNKRILTNSVGSLDYKLHQVQNRFWLFSQMVKKWLDLKLPFAGSNLEVSANSLPDERVGEVRLNPEVEPFLSALESALADLRIELRDLNSQLRRLEVVWLVLLISIISGSLFWLKKYFLNQVEKTNLIAKFQFEEISQVASLSEQKLTEVSKRSSFLKDVITYSPFATLVFNQEGMLDYVNEKFKELFPRVPWSERISIAMLQDILNISPSGKISREKVSMEQRPFNSFCSAFTQWQPYEGLFVSDGSGSQRYLHIVVKPFTDVDHNLHGMIVTCSDVSDRITTECEMRKARIKAEEANLAKTEFLANISHEVRTPMTSILGYTEILSKSSLLTAVDRSSLDAIKRSSKVLIKVIDDILDIAKIESDKLEIKASEHLTLDLLRDVYLLTIPAAQEKQVALHIYIDTILPETVHLDAKRLRQILLNLVGNAIKFTKEGTVELRVKYTKEFLGRGSLEFQVIDTGCGIERRLIPALFRPFAQADGSLTRKFGGTGLGLALSKNLSRAMGGDLYLKKTKINEGSIFVCSMEVKHASQIMLDLSNQQPLILKSDNIYNRTLDMGWLKGAHILLVEDVKENQILCAQALRNAGCQVTTADDGLEAVEKALANCFDLILMDIQMPRMDGYQAVSVLRQQLCQVPILALTAHALPEDRQRCLSAGFDDHIMKPFETNQLYYTLAKHLSGSQSRESMSFEGEAIEGKEDDRYEYANTKVIRQSATVHKIIHQFVKELPTRIQDLQCALDRGDPEDLRQISHKLKGALGACGLTGIMMQVAEFEGEITSDPDYEVLQDRLHDLRQSIMANELVAMAF